MYNTDIPTRAELPSSQQLRRSTIVAVFAAAAILATIVLPAEYGVDPTGIGGVLGLTEMGEIKTQLAAEAAADAASVATTATSAAPLQRSSVSAVQGMADRPPAASALAPPAAPREAPTVVPPVEWRDETSFTLVPGQGVEIKLRMAAGERADFSWSAKGGVVNFDTHGDGGGRSISYEKGRGVPGDEGVLEAAFDGNHGWFWRNRSQSDVQVVLRTGGDYAEIKRML